MSVFRALWCVEEMCEVKLDHAATAISPFASLFLKLFLFFSLWELSVFCFPRCVEEMWEVKLDHAAANITTFPPTSVQYLIWDGKEMYDGTDVAY